MKTTPQSPQPKPWYRITAAAGGVGKVEIFDFIDAYGVSAKGFSTELKALGDVSALHVHINSPGGDVFEGQAIYSMLKSHKAPTTVFIDGLAASMASVIAMAGDTIVMPENAMMMIHDPSTFAFGSADDFRKNADVLDKIKQTLVAAYRAKSGLADETIQSMMSEETWLTASEAISLGFADDMTEEVKIAAAYNFDMKKFKNCPPGFLAGKADPGPAHDRAGLIHSAESTAQSKGIETMKLTPQQRAAELARTTAILTAGDALIAMGPPASTYVQAMIDDGTDAEAAFEKIKAYKVPEKTAPAPSNVVPIDVNKAVTDALAAERTRGADIRASAEKLGLTGIPKFEAMVQDLITKGTSAADAREKLFEARITHEQSDGPIVSFTGNTQTFDNPEFRRDALATAFAARYSTKVTPVEQSREFMTFSPLDMAAELLQARGERISRGNREQLIVKALHTSSDFPLLLADAANKMLLPEYAAANPTYKVFAAQKTFNDFKQHKFLRLGDFPNLLEVGEAAEITRGTISENKEAVTLASYGRILPVSRQMLINDDLSAFADLAMKAGRRVAIFENDLVFAQLLLNAVGPTMSDGNALFHTSHANFQTTGTSLNVISKLSAARAAMMKQTGLDGLKLNLRPSILLVGPDNQTAAEQITAKTTAQRATAFNPFAGTLTPVADANITDYAWMLFADPNDAPVMVYGSLPGQAGPLVATKQGWDTDGVEIKVQRDFGTGAVDFRGAYRDDGAAPEDEPVAT